MKNVRKTLKKGGSLFLLFALALICLVVSYNYAVSSMFNRIPRGPRWSRPNRVDPDRDPARRFHVAVTASDTPYSKWQCRIMYYWFKKFRDGVGSDMGGFTRVLHSGRADNLMDEIPTFVVDPLPEGLDQGYVVLNRPWAFVQWLEKATIQEDYILMGEPDHIFVRPLPNLAYGKQPAAFPFIYIKPAQHAMIIRKFYPLEKGPINNVDPIGNSPVIITKSMLKKMAITWLNVSLSIKNDKEADKEFGWVQEMYAYAIASAWHGVKHSLHTHFMVQPPFDSQLGEAYIIHYTYDNDFTSKGKLTYGKKGEWSWSKRHHLNGPPPRNLTPPPLGVPQTVISFFLSCICTKIASYISNMNNSNHTKLYVFIWVQIGSKIVIFNFEFQWIKSK